MACGAEKDGFWRSAWSINAPYVFCVSCALLQSAQASFSSLLMNPSAALMLRDMSEWLHEGQAEVV